MCFHCSGTGIVQRPLEYLEDRRCPYCLGYGFMSDDDIDLFNAIIRAESDDTEPNPLAWLEELDDDDPLRTGESEWERGIRRGTSN